ncbi:MAG: hypothetical protein AB1657_06165 [Candidatus Micrarchaeota archaeon]
MQKHFTPAERKRLAALYHAERGLLVGKAYGSPPQGAIHPRAARFQKLVEHLGAASTLDAAVGTGIPTLIDIDKIPVGRNLHCSDGDAQMLEVLREKTSPAVLEMLSGRIFHAKWEELPRIFEMRFDLVIILGNSIPYALGWHGEHASTTEMRNVVSASFSGILGVLKPDGKLLFDLAKYSGGRIQLGKALVGGLEEQLSIEAGYEDGRRYWTIWTGHDNLTVEGIALTIEEISQLLKDAGFRNVIRVPDELQLDLPFYESFLALK